MLNIPSLHRLRFDCASSGIIIGGALAVLPSETPENRERLQYGQSLPLNGTEQNAKFPISSSASGINLIDTIGTSLPVYSSQNDVSFPFLSTSVSAPSEELHPQQATELVSRNLGISAEEGEQETGGLCGGGKSARSAPQSGDCRVCGDRASGLYFGALVCVPCKVKAV